MGNVIAGVEPVAQAVAIGTTKTPFISAFRWDNTAGFGNEIDTPASLPPGKVRGVAFSPAGTEIIMVGEGSPYVTAYAWSTAGFGAKFDNPSTLPGGIQDTVTFSPDGNFVAMGGSNAISDSNGIMVYPWSSSGFGSAVSAATGGSYDASNHSGITWAPGSDYIGITLLDGFSVWPWSASGFGTYISSPSFHPNATNVGRNAGASSRHGLAFSPSNEEIVVLSPGGNEIDAWNWNQGSYGSLFDASSVTKPGGIPNCLAFTPNGNFVAVGSSHSPFLQVYALGTGGWSEKEDNPSEALHGQVRSVCFSDDNAILFVGGQETPFLEAYAWSASGFGSKYSDPTHSLDDHGALGIAFNHDLA
jgi:hypothetical protein